MTAIDNHGRSVTVRIVELRVNIHELYKRKQTVIMSDEDLTTLNARIEAMSQEISRLQEQSATSILTDGDADYEE